MKWKLKFFKELTLSEFHDLLKLRIDIFVVEQNCPYHELDGKDKNACHLLGINDDGKIIAYTRIFEPGVYYKEAAFGRVVVHKDFRKQQIGYELIQQTISAMHNLYGVIPIKIGAQTYLKKFYSSFGFSQSGKPYIEDGIPHIHMIKKS
jgi:ElaA protein